jgi:hypothetical protein
LPVTGAFAKSFALGDAPGLQRPADLAAHTQQLGLHWTNDPVLCGYF